MCDLKQSYVNYLMNHRLNLRIPTRFVSWLSRCISVHAMINILFGASQGVSPSFNTSL